MYMYMYLHCYLPYSAFNWPKNSKCICSGVLIQYIIMSVLN